MVELAHLRKTFADNGYPEEFVEVALPKGPMTAEEEAASGDRTVGDGEEVEELALWRFLSSRSCSRLSGRFVL